ncbi:MAG: GNAT family N-acetyltransferase [Phycisphaerales bacterium]
MELNIRIAETSDLEQARELIREYGASIADVAACSLEHQRFEDELRELPGSYARSRGGRLLVAWADSHPAGCVALRSLPQLGPYVCEMKRLYVRPPFRKLGLGRMLVERVLDEARTAGYTLMKLDTDTAPKFDAAIGLYRAMGFTECERYNADPDPKTLWFERRL